MQSSQIYLRAKLSSNSLVASGGYSFHAWKTSVYSFNALIEEPWKMRSGGPSMQGFSSFILKRWQFLTSQQPGKPPACCFRSKENSEWKIKSKPNSVRLQMFTNRFRTPMESWRVFQENYATANAFDENFVQTRWDCTYHDVCNKLHVESSLWKGGWLNETSTFFLRWFANKSRLKFFAEKKMEKSLFKI